jgi:hypothetical protein
MGQASLGQDSSGQDSLGRVYFHCSNTRGVLVDQRGKSVVDLIDAIEEATSLVRSRIAAPTLEDWRDWVLHVSDEAGEEIFVLPFVSVLGKAH